MGSRYYCKKCGNPISAIQFEEKTSYCKSCDANIERKDMIGKYTRDARVIQLKAIHTLMAEANDEEIYMTWTDMFPDCPTEEDFVYIAISDDEYNECFDLFVRLIKRDGNRY